MTALWLVESWTSWLIIRVPAVLTYWAAQGTFFFALFVAGHDCGHGSFSVYPLLNDIIGTVSHGFLMVPYYQWKLSHRNHHKHTGNIDKDEVFYPVRRSEQPPNPRLLPGFALGVGWFIYLVTGYVHFTCTVEAYPYRVTVFLPRNACISAAYAIVWCLSVWCLSHSCIVSERLEDTTIVAIECE